MTQDKKSADRRIDYIELNVGDVARAKAFYGDAFGWTFKDFGPDYCEFSDGRMRGGFNGTGPVRVGGPLIVLYGANLDDLIAQIEAAGGTIVKPTYEFPGGHRFHFTDPDGYELAVWSDA